MKLFTINQAAEEYGIPARTLYKLCAAGVLLHLRVGLGRGRIYLRPSDLDRYLDQSRQQAQAQLKDYLA